MSPNFLYRIERDQPAAPGSRRSRQPVRAGVAALVFPVEQHAGRGAAARWPARARCGSPRCSTAQVRACCATRRRSRWWRTSAASGCSSGTSTWCGRTCERFPDFDDGLRLSMRRETELFLENIVREDGSVLDLLDANYTFLNERLARFYGIPGVTGPEFRRVDMSGTQRGGGILAQASVLTVSSYSTRTSPVLRGKWILENLLNAPPPAPPPDVPALDETKVGADPRRCGSRWRSIARIRPARPAMRAWTRSASAWRTSTRSAPGGPRTASFRSMRPASLPDGRSFQTPAELKAILLRRTATPSSRGLTEKLLTYALGPRPGALRPPDGGRDRGQAARRSDYRFSALVLGDREQPAVPDEARR